MYVIIEAGGHQWKVEPGTRLSINRVDGEVGATHTVDRVLFAHDGQKSHIGTPYLVGAKVLCEVLAHPRGPKVISYKFRRRENWRKTIGHRQDLTTLLVKEIQVGGVSAAANPATSEKAPAKTPTVKAASPKLPTAPHGTKPAAKRTTKE